ncbi:MAG TPA: hypothetical protein DCX06_03575 [Opitutae bacterium]|mgnify:CR=1 FL=1|nr:hypothetical protein [Opitutae bacterium]
MSHRCLTDLKKEAGSASFYFKALQYGHYLWLQGHAGRALLAITRALYSSISADAEVLKTWPLPYAALAWVLENHCSDDFPGNPRISFQHQATRLRGERQELRRARAWAVWALICKVRPSLPADKNQKFEAPSLEEIAGVLKQLGHPSEAEDWHRLLNT